MDSFRQDVDKDFLLLFSNFLSSIVGPHVLSHPIASLTHSLTRAVHTSIDWSLLTVCMVGKGLMGKGRDEWRQYAGVYAVHTMHNRRLYTQEQCISPFVLKSLNS